MVFQDKNTHTYAIESISPGSVGAIAAASSGGCSGGRETKVGKEKLKEKGKG